MTTHHSTFFPLSPLQAGMLSQHLRASGSGVDIEQIVCTLPEAVDAVAMAAAWQEIVARHDMLRTAFRWEGGDAPSQHTTAVVDLPFVTKDWSETPADQRATRLDDFLRSDRRRGIDLSCAPLLRLTLIRWGADDFQLVWTFHHAILDGRSFTIVLRELFDVYDRRPSDISAPPTFQTHVEWLAAADWSAARTFWTERLAGVGAATPLPAAPRRDRRAIDKQGDRSVALSVAATTALLEMASATDLTLNAIVQGAWAILLATHAEQDDVVFGVVRAGRRSSVAGADEMVGLLINTLPLDLVVNRDAPLVEWLRSVRARWNEMRPYEHTPLPVVQGCSGVPAGQPLFETAVMFERYELEEVLREGGGAAAARGFRLYEQNGFALTLTAYAGAHLTLRLEYDASRYDAATADALLDQMCTLLEAFPAHQRDPVGKLSLLSPAAREQVTRTFNATARDYPVDATLLDLLEDQAVRVPREIAVVDGAVSVTYAELHSRADSVARQLHDRGVGPGMLVGVSLERSVELVVALLGVLKAGAAYVPLDPDYPAERLDFMRNDSGVTVVIDAQWQSRELAVPMVAPPRPVAADPAYMIYTSGSTGQPKGALNSHAGIVNRLLWMQEQYRLGPDDAVLQKTPISFDVSVWEFFWPLMSGARLVLARPGGHRDPEYLADVIARERITVTHFVPSMLQAFLADAAPGQSTTLRDVICSGEALGVDLTMKFFATFPAARLHNLYGPTEAAVDVSYWECASDEQRLAVPIGRPVANTQLYVLDGTLTPTAIGAPGELYIAGVQVGMGYHNRPALTAERFVHDPFSSEHGARMYRTGDRACWLADGALDYRGRIDHQVKLHGQRLELGEVEAHLTALPGVAAAVAQIWKDGANERLVAWYVPAAGAEPTSAELRAGLLRVLPPGVVPASFVRLEALPLTPNGKLDRKGLPAPDAADHTASEFVPPVSAAERELAGIWEAALRRTPVGITDNFFELGGDSILMIQIVARARAAGIRVTLSDFFEFPTIAELAGRAGNAGTDSHLRGNLESAPLTPVQRWFFATQPAAPNHWNQAFLFAVPGDFDFARFREALDEVVRGHDALRTRFVRTAEGWRQELLSASDAVACDQVEVSDVSKIAAACDAAQHRVNLSAGPLLSARHLRLGGNEGRLLLAAHHLVIDGISWRILLEEIEAAYRGSAQGAPSTTFMQWATALEQVAHSDDVRREAPHWHTVVAAGSTPLPVDHDVAPPSVEGNTQVISVALDEGETAALLQRVPAAYKTQINDVLLTALGTALGRWVAPGQLLVDVEGHGREEIVAGADISRTIGWFTTIFPLALALPLAADPRAALRSVRQQLRAIPRRGIGFGLLTMGGDDVLAKAGRPQVLFNYFGQLDALVAGSELLRFAPESGGTWRDPQARRTHRLQVDALVLDSRFEVRWAYDRLVHRAETVQQLADSFRAALRDLIAGCEASEPLRYAPEDFPLAALDQQALDRITSGVRDVEEIYPVVPMQRLFLGYLSAGADDPGFEQWRYTLRGNVDVDRLHAAWQGTVDRHAILRTAFRSAGGAEPLQVVRARVELPWAQHDWRNVGRAEQPARLAELLRADRVRGFAADTAPLMRLTLLRLADDEYELIWSHHHLLLDRWSWALVLRDVENLYSGDHPVLPPPVAYRDYVAWLAAQDEKGAESFWREALSHFASPHAFPRRPVVTTSLNGPGESRIELTVEATAALRTLAAQSRVGVNTLVQGAWALWLAHHFDTTDVVYGVSVSGRTAELAGAGQIVGMTINNIPVRVPAASDRSLGEWLRDIQRRQGDLQRFGHVALEEIQRWSGIPWRHRLFESLLVFQDATTDDVTSGWLGQSIAIERHHAPTQTGYPISLVVGGSDRLSLQVTFDTAYFLQETAGQCLEAVRNILLGMTVSGATTGSLLAVLRPEERGIGAASIVEIPGPTYVAPSTAAEAVTAGLWGDLLGRERIGVTEDFFQLGGHSLLALQVVSRIRDTFRLEVPVRALFAAPTVEAFTRAVIALERKPGQVERIAQLVQQVASMSSEQVQAAEPVVQSSQRD